ncbi:MAG: transcriptional repressor [Bacteroidaceae bacterium]|nr:transcriptional repressor [Bacteroidaceae bacterium]
MYSEDYLLKMEKRGVKPTATRLLVLRALGSHHRALSLRELDDILETIDRSTIFRALTLFLANHLVHAIEDGTGVTKYEICEGHEECSIEDQHTHFFCVGCHRTFCFHNTPVPTIEMPEGFVMQNVNYLVKGLCPDCSAKAKF